MIAQRLAALGLDLPSAPRPLAGYQPAVRDRDHLWTSGQLPLRDGQLIYAGKVGAEVTIEQASTAAQQCALNALAALAGIIPLDEIRQIIKVTGFIASSPDFIQQPQVLDGASSLLLDLFDDRGRHARSAVGVAVLPLNAPVEVELIVRVA